MLQFEHSIFAVAALITAVLLFLYYRRTLAVLVVFLVLLAGSGVFWLNQMAEEQMILLIDDSPSMEAVMQEDIESLLVSNYSSYDEIMYLSQCFANRESTSLGDSDITSALYYAANKIKANGTIVLYSDLLVTSDGIVQVAEVLAGRNISLIIEQPHYQLDNEVILSDIEIPDVITRNQKVSACIKIESSHSTVADLVSNNNITGVEHVDQISLEPGINEVQLELDSSGQELSYSISIECSEDTCLDNNTETIIAKIMPKPSVTILGNQSGSTLETYGSLSLYADVRYYNGGLLPASDLYIISDVSLDVFTPELIEDLRVNVLDGSGLLVVPSPTLVKHDLLSIPEFTDMLPAKAVRSDIKSSPDGCIVFIVDTSGSMQGTRLVLAREIVRSSINRLNSYDKVGIVEFYGKRKWAIPIRYATEQVELNRAVNRLTAGGGTVIIPALQEAYYGLLNTRSSSKHIVVITDGGIETGDYESILSRISNDNINVSFVLTGPAANTGFLADMSFAGGGKFLHAKDRFSIPVIDIKTLSSKKPSLFQQNYSDVNISNWRNFSDGINATDIADFSFIPVNKKMSAVELLYSDNESYITCWQYGLGKVVLDTTDIMQRTSADRLLGNISRVLYELPEDQVSVSTGKYCNFEIKACSPDQGLARKLSHYGSSNSHVELIDTINLSPYLIMLAIILFALQVLHRRLPVKIAVLSIVLMSGTGLFADFSESMSNGCVMYLEDDPQCMQYFEQAINEAVTENDLKYSLAFCAVAAEKYSKFDDFEAQQLSNLDPVRAGVLNKIYAMRGDFDSSCAMLERASQVAMNTAVIQELESQMVNIAISGRQYEKAKEYYQAKGDYIALMKLHLLDGPRDKAKELACRLSDDVESSSLYSYICSFIEMDYIDLAVSKAQILMLRKDEYYFDIVSLMAQLYSSSGQNDKCRVLLQEAISGYNFSNSQLFEIALLFEQNGNIDIAIDVHRELYRQTRAIDCLMRIASLKKNSGDLDSAYELLFDIWQQTEKTFLLYQVTPALLDLAAKTNKLVDLVISLEDALESGNASDKQLDLLINIYTGIDDVFTPIELVKQYYPKPTVESMQKECYIYRSCGIYAKCQKVLEELIVTDKSNSVEYLQQMAILALQNQDQDQALTISDDILAKSEDVGLEFSAGIYFMAGRYDKAMELYGRLINANPDNYELWLLWADSAAQCSEKEVEFAQYKMLEFLNNPATDTELFLIAADALINLESSKDILRQAYNQTIKKISVEQSKVCYYQLACDLLTEIDPAESQISLLLRGCSYVNQGKEIYLSEAISSLDDSQTLKHELAMVLIYMDMKCPPAEYINYGMMFLTNGKHKVAEYLFRANSLLNDDNKDLYLAISDSYQRQAEFNLSLNILSEALALYPSDLQFIIETASVNEILGDYSSAYNLYLRAYKLTDNLGTSQDNSNSKNIDSDRMYRRIAYDGLIVCCDGEFPDFVDLENVNLIPPVVELKAVEKKEKKVSSPQEIDTENTVDLDMVNIELEELVSAGIIDSDFYRALYTILDELTDDQVEYLYNDFTALAFIDDNNPALSYLNALLAWQLGQKDAARDYITQCYKAVPQNRYVERWLKEYYEDGDLYYQLADILLDSTGQMARSSFFWRELTRIYYCGGDLDKALWANSFSAANGHELLTVMDRLFLYYKQGDIERVEQYFRKYQIDCRAKGKYFSLKWNYWDVPRSELSTYDYQTVYIVLSERKELKDEFERYYRIVNSKRRDCQRYEQAYYKCLQAN